MDPQTETMWLELTAQTVAAHVANNVVSLPELPALIMQVHRSLASLDGTTLPITAPVVERPQPAVPIKKSVTDEFLICLDNGKRLKMLKRHLKVAYNMTPDQCRERWGLPFDYPMVAPSYAKHCSTLAKESGLGTSPRVGCSKRART